MLPEVTWRGRRGSDSRGPSSASFLAGTWEAWLLKRRCELGVGAGGIEGAVCLQGESGVGAGGTEGAICIHWVNLGWGVVGVV